jgi:hypothetical protein
VNSIPWNTLVWRTQLAYWRTGEGDQRGGVNGSQSKFLVGSQPISQTRPDAPLLTCLRPHSYEKAIGPRNWVRNPENTAEDNNRSSKTPFKTDDKKSDLRTVYILTTISPNICWVSLENHDRFESWILESSEPVTQECHQLHPTTIHTQCEQNQCQKRTWSAWEKTIEAPQLRWSSAWLKARNSRAKVQITDRTKLCTEDQIAATQKTEAKILTLTAHVNCLRWEIQHYTEGTGAEKMRPARTESAGGATPGGWIARAGRMILLEQENSDRTKHEKRNP